jgi:TPR repeat protein
MIFHFQIRYTKEIASKKSKQKFLRNPTNAMYCAMLANIYFNGIGTKQSNKKAKFLYKKLHQRKYDTGTFGLLACMKKENATLQSRFEICLERTDTNNRRLLYKIGKGHLEKIYGERCNFEEGIHFLKRSISKGFSKAITFLCLHLLRKRFGEEKTLSELYLESEKLKESSSHDDQVYFGVCLFLGIGISSDKRLGQYLIDSIASNQSALGKYYQRILYGSKSPSFYSLIDYSIH